MSRELHSGMETILGLESRDYRIGNSLVKKGDQSVCFFMERISRSDLGETQMIPVPCRWISEDLEIPYYILLFPRDS